MMLVRAKRIKKECGFCDSFDRSGLFGDFSPGDLKTYIPGSYFPKQLVNCNHAIAFHEAACPGSTPGFQL